MTLDEIKDVWKHTGYAHALLGDARSTLEKAIEMIPDNSEAQDDTALKNDLTKTLCLIDSAFVSLKHTENNADEIFKKVLREKHNIL